MQRQRAEPPLIAVVIPAYNRESCIGEAIESVLAQDTPCPFEIIVVDDGSTDRTSEVARSYGPPVRAISKKNGGPASARNAGVLAAQSPLIAFLDSDDLMLPGRLARQADYLLSHPEVVLTFGDIIGDIPQDKEPGESYLQQCHLPFVEEQWLIVEDPYRRLLTCGNFVPNVTAMLRRRDYLEAGMMDESLRVSEDLELWTRLCARGRFAYFCGPLVRVRRNYKDNLMASSYAFTDRARARHKMLLRDQTLSDQEKRQALALLRWFLRRMLRYDLRERGRQQMLKDLREIGSWFGPWYYFQWWIVSLIPQPLARLVHRFRQRKLTQQGP